MIDDALACFPTRIDWEMTLPAIEGAPFPAPLVTSRDGQQDVHPAPSAVEKMIVYAVRSGWAVVTTYAEGWVPHGTTGKPIGPRPSWALRMSRGDQRAIAVYMAGKWSSMWMLGDALKIHAAVDLFKKALA